MSYPNARDCKHGSKRGKCDLCDMEERIAELERESVKNIMLSVVPGDDGMGHEVYAASVKEVEAKLTTLAETVESLEAQNAELRKDAERYRWLRDTHGYRYGMGSDTPAECGIAFGWQQSCPEESHLGIEQAIDAALAKIKEAS